MTSWHPGCPVARGQLRLLVVTYWGFDGRVHYGQLVVNADAVGAIASALRQLFIVQFPIRQMRLLEAFESSDDSSMAADNTSAFNCRLVPGSASWSQHAYGRAIDINPLENPEIENGSVFPPNGSSFVDRTRHVRGMIRGGDAVVRAFATVGWGWGGRWGSLKDYQHFWLSSPFGGDSSGPRPGMACYQAGFLAIRATPKVRTA